MWNTTSVRPHASHVGYVLKRYPRYSETFIVNEILAHEAAGQQVTIFSLLAPGDSHFQDAIARVRAPVYYLLAERGLRASDFWQGLRGIELAHLPADAPDEDARAVYQAALLAQAVRQHGLTHLHAHFGTQATTVARLAFHLTGCPYSFTAHAKDIFHNDVSPIDLQRKLMDASAVITVSDYNLDYLREQYGMAAERVQRIYNGLELNRFSYHPGYERRKHLVAVGRLVEKKGFPVLIDACSILASAGVDFSCEIIGAGPLEQALREQIEHLGLSQIVSLPGPRPQQELIECVRAGAMFVAPCIQAEDGDRDGLPTVLLEAMALGVPAIGTDVTGIPEIIQDEVTGLLVPQNDAQTLSRAILRLLHNPELGQHMARAARRLIETEFNIHHNAAQLRECFQHGQASGIRGQGSGGQGSRAVEVGRCAERHNILCLHEV